MEENKSHCEILLEKLTKAVNYKYSSFHYIKFSSLGDIFIVQLHNNVLALISVEDTNLCRAFEKLAEKVLLAPEPKKEQTPADELNHYLSQHNSSKFKPNVLGAIIPSKGYREYHRV